MSSNGTSAPPETSSASCQAASSTKAARESCSARLCMRGEFAAPIPGPPTRTWACKVDQRRRTETAIYAAATTRSGGAATSASAAHTPPSHSAPYVRMLSMIGTRARPFSVSAYSTRGGTSGYVRRSRMPSSSSARSRSDSVRGEMPPSERSSSQNRERPSERSRTIRSVHFPQTMSAVRQTGQSGSGISLHSTKALYELKYPKPAGRRSCPPMEGGGPHSAGPAGAAGQRAVDAGSGRRRLQLALGAHCDALRLQTLGLRDDQGEHAMLHGGRDAVGVDPPGHAERALERPEGSLGERPRRPVRHLGALAHAADGEGVIDELDVDVVGRQARQIQGEHQVAAADRDVGRRRERRAARDGEHGERIAPQHL